MNLTIDRFQGTYLGGIIGEAIAAPTGDSDRFKIINYQGQHWLTVRNALAETIIKAPRLEIDDLITQLEQLLGNDNLDCYWQDFIKDNQNNSLREKSLSRAIVPKNQKSTLLKCHSSFLVLLPLVIFLSDNQDLFKQVITQCNLKSAINRETKEDILIWSYLLSLNNKFELENKNLSQIIKRVLTDVELKTTNLIEKLELVIRAWESGLSLHEITEKLLSLGNSKQIAIALSCYCFASTPQDFKLSVKRAASLNQNIAWWTTSLTGTLSGAYNGVTGIPKSWRAIADKNQTYQQAQHTAMNLYKTWLGIYSLEISQTLYNHELDAVASTNIIQPRKSLKIISQKSYLS